MAHAQNVAVHLDPNTYSNYKSISIIHTDIDWEVHFDSQKLVGMYINVLYVTNNTKLILEFTQTHNTTGSVTHTLKLVDDKEAVDVLSLDTYGLEITEISHASQKLHYEIAAQNKSHPKTFGRQLNIDIKNIKFDAESKNTCQITIKYCTSPDAEAIQWLPAEITDSKLLPYLFTQCYPIAARTMLPCQDTPGGKFSYNAIIKTPKKLSNGKECKFTALMSAPTSKEFTKCDNESDNDWTIHTIKQERKIPSYLLALVVGNIELSKINDNDKCICYVATEPQNIHAVKWEFANMESYLGIAKSFCGEYRWSTYGCVVLPSSFPCMFYLFVYLFIFVWFISDRARILTLFANFLVCFSFFLFVLFFVLFGNMTGRWGKRWWYRKCKFNIFITIINNR